MGVSTFFDHHPVSFQINLSNDVLEGSSWKANGRFLIEAWELIKALWEMLLPQKAFFTKMGKVVKFYKQFCLAKATESRLEESRLRQHLEFWQVILHSDTTYGTTKPKIKMFRDKLQSLADKKEVGCKIRSWTQSMQYGDHMNKHFFFSVRERPAGRLVSVDHRFYSCPPCSTCVEVHCQHHLATFAKNSNLRPRKFFSMLQCFSNQPLCKTLKRFSCIWFFLRSGLPWIIWRQRNDLTFNKLQWPIEKTRQIILDAL